MLFGWAFSFSSEYQPLGLASPVLEACLFSLSGLLGLLGLGLFFLKLRRRRVCLKIEILGTKWAKCDVVSLKKVAKQAGRKPGGGKDDEDVDVDKEKTSAAKHTGTFLYYAPFREDDRRVYHHTYVRSSLSPSLMRAGFPLFAG